jgi:hypothetical protein
MTTKTLRKLYGADGIGTARCPLCDDPRLSINAGRKPGSTIMLCHECGPSATRAILAKLGLTFADLYEKNDPRFRPALRRS